MTLLTRSAVDAQPATGCRACPPGRDALSGWGRLDVAAAVAQAQAPRLPPRDRLETNDDAGPSAKRLYGGRAGGLEATIDFWDDQTDVYAVRLRAGQRLNATMLGPPRTRLFLWRPGTRTVEGLSVALQRRRIAQSIQRGAAERIAYRASSTGWYFLQVKIAAPGAGAYRLRFAKS